MASKLNSFLANEIDNKNIKNSLAVDNLNIGDSLSNKEIFTLGVKGYDSFQKFYFDVDDNMFICLNNVDYDEYKGVLNIAFKYQNKNILESKIINKIFKQKFKKILCFSKDENGNNLFLGNFNFVTISKYYSEFEQFESLMIIRDNFESLDCIVEFNNLNKRKLLLSLERFKESCIEIFSHEKYNLHLIERLKTSNNHFCIAQMIIEHCINLNDKKTIEQLVVLYPEIFKSEFNVHKLEKNLSAVNEFQLCLLTNSYETLFGKRVSVDYMNNINIVINKDEIKTNGEEVIFNFLRSYKNHYFDIKINQKIFNASNANNDSIIYVWEQLSNKKYLLSGHYKVSSIFTETIDGEEFPIFKFRPLTGVEYCSHRVYMENNISNNSYKNVFINLISENSPYRKWMKNTAIQSVVETEKINDKNNSILNKYNWIVNKFLNTFEDNLLTKYQGVFNEFNSRLLNNMINCYKMDLNHIESNNLLSPWVIANELLKMNYINSDLTNISYEDFYITKKEKYELLKNVLNFKN
ncbi:MAG: hypothetical protein ACRC42_04290 [Mycoplasma sp.]